MLVKSLGSAAAFLPVMASAFGGLGIGIVGPYSPEATLHAREEGTPVDSSAAVITSEPKSMLEYSAKFGAGHLNLLKARGLCAKRCDWEPGFCVQNDYDGYAGCCDGSRYTSCLAATTCVDFTRHQNTVSIYNATRTLLCPYDQPYCTSTYDPQHSFTFVDCGENPVPKTTPTTSSTDRTTDSPTNTPTDTTKDDEGDSTDGDSQGADGGSSGGKKKSFGAGAGAGVAVGGVVLIAAIVGLIFFLRKRRRNRLAADPTPPPPPVDYQYSPQNQDMSQAQNPGYFPPQGYPSPHQLSTAPPYHPVQHHAPPPGVQEVYAPLAAKPGETDTSSSQHPPYNSYYAPSTDPSGHGPGYQPQSMQYPGTGASPISEMPATSYPGKQFSAPPPGELLVEAPTEENEVPPVPAKDEPVKRAD